MMLTRCFLHVPNQNLFGLLPSQMHNLFVDLMPQKRPIFFFAFANNSDYRLSLEKEERALRESLRDLDRQAQIEYKSIGQTNLEDIYNTFNSYHNRIYFFHYGGHSNSGFLHLSDRDAHSEHLSTLIGQQKHLKLVFLNGCANLAQVVELFNKGVPAVIATRKNIDDELSIKFAEQFYRALAGGKTIRDAFDATTSFIKQIKPALDIDYRGISFRETDNEVLPWGLYAQNESALKWSINSIQIDEMPQKEGEILYTVNQYLNNGS